VSTLSGVETSVPCRSDKSLAADLINPDASPSRFGAR
jgi:hypothetical protein